MALFPDAAMLEGLANPALMEDWHELRLLRDQANVEIERQRKAKVIGTSLGARLTVEAAGEDYATAAAVRRGLADAVHRLGGVPCCRADDGTATLRARSVPPAVKCDRCWRYVPRVSSEPGREGLCDRCVEALGEPVAS